MTASSSRCALMLCLWLPTLAFAGGPPWPGAANPPNYVPRGAGAFWAALAQHAEEQSEAMIRDTTASTRFQRSDFTAGDMACMRWWNAWSQLHNLQRQGRPIPPAFLEGLEKAQETACHDDDDDSGPGAPTGRGWNTIRRAVLGRGDVQKAWRPLTPQELEVALTAAKWTAVGAAVLLSLPSLAVP